MKKGKPMKSRIEKHLSSLSLDELAVLLLKLIKAKESYIEEIKKRIKARDDRLTLYGLPRVYAYNDWDNYYGKRFQGRGRLKFLAKQFLVMNNEKPR
ncbi:MAG: hypothetical protein ACE5WD_11705 [Candidatus Aminicenantia bacterium]